MKGVVFTEFLDFVADSYNHIMVDDIIEDSNLEHGGAYTSVGTYPYTEMQSLIVALSHRTAIGVPDLLTTFGSHLCRRFVVKYPEFFHSETNLFDFLESVDRHIHVEVHKLYPDAELPIFNTNLREVRRLALDYRSCRPLAFLAEGMIQAAADHYGQAVTIERTKMEAGDDTFVRFDIRLAA